MDAHGQYSPEKRYSDQKPGGENFTVEDLLDFSNEDDVMTDAFYDLSIIPAGNSNDSSTVVTPLDSCNSSVSGNEMNFPSGNFSDSKFSADICVPYEDMLHLEWLSNFVEEDNNYSTEEQYHFQNPHLIPEPSKPLIQTHIQPNYPTQQPEISPVPAKAQRSKRSRAAPANWSSRLLHLITPSSSQTTTMISSDDDIKPKTATFYKRRETNLENTEGRRCLHCQSEKTPQWRTGPMGPKTLCNACGVRFKSGRLVPEYRPAASPTFVSTKHSNSHRKVLELRRQRELHGGSVGLPHHHSHNHNHNHHGAFIGQQHGMFGVSDSGDFMIQHCNGIDYRHLM